jgi:hypothetical protein
MALVAMLAAEAAYTDRQVLIPIGKHFHFVDRPFIASMLTPATRAIGLPRYAASPQSDGRHLGLSD